MPSNLGEIGPPGESSGWGNSVSMTTDTEVETGQYGIFGVVWYGDAGVTLNIGGEVDHAVNPHADANRRAALVRVPGPISADTEVIASLATGTFSRGICGLISEGTDVIDATGSGFGTDGSWEAPLTPTEGIEALIIALGWVDFTTNSQTPNTGYTQVSNFPNVGNNTSIGLVAREVSDTVGTYTPGADSGAGNPNVAGSIAYSAVASAESGHQMMVDGVLVPVARSLKVNDSWASVNRRRRVGDAWV